MCVYLEPIALYHTRDLHEQGDNEWLAPYRRLWERSLDALERHLDSIPDADPNAETRP